MKSIELFSGTGGLAIGLQLAGFSHEALYEWDKDSCDNVEYNIRNGYLPAKEWKVYQTDVRQVDYSQYIGNVHMVSGGPPCQPFSLGGKGKAYNDKRDMFPEAVRAVREIKPEVFIFENVKGLLRSSFSEYFDYIILQLTYPDITKTVDMSWEEHLALLRKAQYETCSGLKYSVKYQLLDAADYGVPQSRHRVFIVGFRSDLQKSWECPAATHSKEKLIYEQWVTGTYWSAFNMKQPLNCPYSTEQLKKIKTLVESGKVASQRWQTVRDAIFDLPDPQVVFNRSIFFDHDYRPGARIYPGHSGSSLDLPSKTIKAGAHGVPGGENMVELDDGNVRYYTVRESARIQTFPDSYRFSASWTESMRQIGNAVPVKLASMVGKSVLQQLKGE